MSTKSCQNGRLLKGIPSKDYGQRIETCFDYYCRVESQKKTIEGLMEYIDSIEYSVILNKGMLLYRRDNKHGKKILWIDILNGDSPYLISHKEFKGFFETFKKDGVKTVAAKSTHPKIQKHLLKMGFKTINKIYFYHHLIGIGERIGF